MPLALLLLAAGLAANVLLGPLGVGLIHWRVSANALNQTYGADAASLVLVVPAAVVAAWLWWRERRLAAPLAVGVGLATLYYAVAETLGGDYVRYEGNNERFFLLFLGLIVLSWPIAVRAWAALDPAPPLPGRWLRRALAIVLLLASTVIGLGWTKQILDIVLTGAAGPEYLESPSAFWTIRIVDLGFIVPASSWTAVGLWQARATAIKLAYGLVSFMTLQGAAVLAMGVVQLWRGDPTASLALVSALAPVVLALTALTIALLDSYARGNGAIASHATERRAIGTIARGRISA